jgi:hypothetical protein
MTGSNDNGAASLYSGSERREHHQLRDIFEQAYRVAFPLLDSKQVIQVNSTTHFLRVVLHDSFPELHQQEIAILSVSIERVYRERSKLENQ